MSLLNYDDDAISRNMYLGSNIAVIKVGQSQISLEAIGDQIIVKEDIFKTGYECKKCDGDGYLENVDCEFCKGTGKENEGTENETMCRRCCSSNVVSIGHYSPGKMTCDICKGVGALIIVTQSAEQKPTTGVILSTGPGVYPDNRVINLVTGQRWDYPMRIGDRILYGIFAGTGINFKQKQLIRIMHAHEVVSKIYGSAKIGDFVK